jgi:[acyl-carrier-protein] S-malonyltransferase
LTILCPGQGAQHVGMGKAWADASQAAAAVFARADDVLGMTLSALCFDGPEDELNRTDVTQAAIYATSVACYRGLRERGEIGEPTAAAGLSLGEFTALHIAGVFDFETGLRLVRLRGQAMQQAAEATPSSMVAITGDVTEEQINALCDAARGDGTASVLVPANFNSAMQVVISGSTDACERSVAVAEQMGFKPTPLKVAGAFHSPIMQPAADELAAALDEATWAAPAIPVVSNVTARPHEAEVQSIKRRLVEQLTSPVRWAQSMQWIVENRATSGGGRLIEVAPGKVLTGLMRRIDRKAKVENFSDPA